MFYSCYSNVNLAQMYNMDTGWNQIIILIISLFKDSKVLKGVTAVELEIIWRVQENPESKDWLILSVSDWKDVLRYHLKRWITSLHENT